MRRTIYEKIRDDHLVMSGGGNELLLYVDRHYIYEVSSPQAFEGMRQGARQVWRSAAAAATMDHNVPTVDRHRGILEPLSRRQVETLAANCREFNIRLYDLDHASNGITHVIFPELGYTHPGMVIACGDSHTSTHGALGALAFGITSDVEHILATQTLRTEAYPNMLVEITGSADAAITAKDITLFVMRELGTGGGSGFIIEFGGEAVTALSVEGRMTLCNMATELNARAAIISPDEKVFAYLKDRPFAPNAAMWEDALDYWRGLPSDPEATYQKNEQLDISGISPQVTWGVTPAHSIGIDELVPGPRSFTSPGEKQACLQALDYMGIKPGTPIEGTRIDFVFIGSCTNGRIEDLRAAAELIKGRKMAPWVQGMVVPGSQSVNAQAVREGLDELFLAAGFQWRQPGCSMCLGMNGDVLSEGQRCASTSNRNFENRQGRGVRTMLLSPPMAAAAAVEGHLVDIRS